MIRLGFIGLSLVCCAAACGAMIGDAAAALRAPPGLAVRAPLSASLALLALSWAYLALFFG